MTAFVQGFVVAGIICALVSLLYVLVIATGRESDRGLVMVEPFIDPPTIITSEALLQELFGAAGTPEV